MPVADGPDPRHRPGHQLDQGDAGRPRAATVVGEASVAARPDPSRSRAGSSRTPTRSGPACSSACAACVSRRVRRARRRGRPQRPARDRRALGPARPGDAVAPALSWQDQRTAAARRRARAAGHADQVLATHRAAARPDVLGAQGRLAARPARPDRARDRAAASGASAPSTPGCSPASAGEPVTEIGNASRTQLLDIDTGRLGRRAARAVRRPARGAAAGRALRRTVPGRARPRAAARRPAGARACMADSHAALFAHAGWRPGVVKATYGTGSSVMALGPRRVGRLAASARPSPGRSTTCVARARGQHPLDRPHPDLARRPVRRRRRRRSVAEAARRRQRRRRAGAGVRRARRAVVGPRRDAP